jgi:3-dehydroquinate synthase
MQKIRVELAERSYNIVIDGGSLHGIGKRLKRFEFSRRLALVSNPTVYGLYGNTVSRSIKSAGFDLVEVIVPDGEGYKDMFWVQNIYEELLKAKLDRKSALVALGGGVIGDITGFAASTYMRGIDYVQVPTTLLAQVDSSVGGKTGVNHKLGKNMIGTFWQPRVVWVDIATLETLPQREFRSGLAEVIKYGVIWDRKFFEFLEEEREKVVKLDRGALAHIIKRSCEIKAEVVSKDERESGLRAILNYGHTVGHAIETATGYSRFLHGEAVAIGMCAEARLSHLAGFVEREQVERIRALVESYGLPVDMPDDKGVDVLIEAMSLDKKAVSGEMKFILPEKIGAVKIEAGVPADTIRNALIGIK